MWVTRRRIEMSRHTGCAIVAVVLLAELNAKPAETQLMSTCTENSPERRGELGCSIVANKLLPTGPTAPVP